MLTIAIDILPGELADRISILALRVEHLIAGPGRTEVEDELHHLRALWESLPEERAEAAGMAAELAAVNRQLWEVEDSLRQCEGEHRFGERFIELARSVYRLNDRRSSLKRSINRLVADRDGEQKCYVSQ